MLNTKKKLSPRDFLLEGLLLVLIVVMTFANKHFMTVNNMFNILRNVAMQGIVAFGMTMVIINGEIDLSVGSTVAMSGIIFGLCYKKFTALPTTGVFVIALLIALFFATVIGLVNTFFVIKFKMPSMITTIATMNIIYGICALVTDGFPVLSFSAGFKKIGSIKLFGQVPISALYLVIVFLIILFVMNKTKFGRNVYACGGNAEAARLSGINVVLNKALTFIIVQWTAVISGIILSSQVQAGNFNYAKDWSLTIISSVVIGGASLNGGVGSVAGTMVGLLFLGVVNNAMTLMNYSEYAQYVVRGALMLFAVVMNTWQAKKR